MNVLFVELSRTLRNLESVVLKSVTDSRTVFEVSGSNHTFAILDRVDLASLPASLAKLIEDRCVEDLSEVETEYKGGLERMIARTLQIQTVIVPHLFNGNGATATSSFVNTLVGMRAWIEEILPVLTTLDPNAVPYKLARQAKRLSASLDSSEAAASAVKEQLELILKAREAAESLPADLADLRRARSELLSITAEVRVEKVNIDLEGTAARKIHGEMDVLNAKAQKLVADCEEAFTITATKGLAAAFDERAKNLTFSVRAWVVLFIVALGAASYIGAQRVALLTASLNGADPKWGVISMNLLLSVVSVGAPLWFAWLASHQISQRFKLVEDYGYKASVAKAYQGYKREAVDLDPELQARLFNAALLRLEEAPLRLLPENSHASPWNELLNSDVIKQAFATIPNFTQDITALAKSKVEKNKAEVEVSTPSA